MQTTTNTQQQTIPFEKIDYYQTLYRLKHRVSSKELAFALCISDDALRKSRSTGYLLGIKAPRHIKLGRLVQYRIEDVIRWIEVSELENTEGM